MIFLLSDFQADGFEQPLSICARRHDLIAVPIEDPGEWQLPPAGIVEVQDPETGIRSVVDFSNTGTRREFARLVDEQRKSRDAIFLRGKAGTIPLRTDQDYFPAVAELFSPPAATTPEHTMMKEFIFLGLTEIVQDIEDIQPPIAEHSFWGIIGILAALLVVALLAYAFWPNRRKPFCLPVLPKEWAHSELARLDDEIATLDPNEAGFRHFANSAEFFRASIRVAGVPAINRRISGDTAQQRLFDPGKESVCNTFFRVAIS